MRIIAAVAALSFCVTAAQAEEKRDLGAHEHGVGQLNIAFEGGAIAMELEAPGADIVGFEHPTESAEDRTKVDAAIATLAKPLELFRLPEAAKCSLVAADVALHGGEGEHHDAHESGEHHESHADSEHHDEAEEEGGHTEFHAEYRFSCAAPEEVVRIEFGYFAVFPNAEELEIQLISDQGTRGFEVERDMPVLDLTGAV